MRRRRKLYYEVRPWDDRLFGYWWVPKRRKWLPSSEIAGLAASSARMCRTFNQAMRAARAVPVGTVLITQFVYRKGRRLCRDYHYRRNNGH